MDAHRAEPGDEAVNEAVNHAVTQRKTTKKEMEMRRRFMKGMALLGLSGGLAARAGAQGQGQTQGQAQGQAGAQGPVRHFVIENTQIVPVDSKYTGKRHELIVVLPSSWGKEPNKTYPVLYFLDGYWDTPLLSATYGNLMYDNFAPEFIMVGLSYPAGTNYDTERRKDYTFSAGKEAATGAGKGAAFLDFITKEAAPLVERQYRGAATGRILSGSSLGGLFTLTAAYQAPGFFAGHIALSPAAGWDGGLPARLDEAYARTHKSMATRMFIAYGAEEYPGFREPIAAFERQLAARRYQGLALETRVMPGLDHTTVKGEAYVRGLIWYWAPQKPSGPSGLTRAMQAERA
jgi:predicted alpha/beta superfamily hydrolase